MRLLRNNLNVKKAEMIKEWIKKWLSVILGVLLLLSFITVGIFAFSWGKQRAENSILKEKENNHLKTIQLQDSIIAAKTISIALLTDSMGVVYEQAIKDNAATADIKVAITKDKNKMYEEINSILFLKPDSNIKLFNKLTDEYEPQ